MSEPISNRRVLLVASTTGYQTRAFAQAARDLGVAVTLATNACRALDDPWGDDAIPVRFEANRMERSVEDVAGEGPFDGIVAVGDRPAHLASLIAARLGLAFHAPGAVAAARNKFATRERFRDAGLATPWFRLATTHGDETACATAATYPCVLKPLGLSGSRGVIRANDPEEFVWAFRRIRDILNLSEVRRNRDHADESLLVEEYIPGREFALDGIVTGGRLRVLALFDKPDPLDGPYFEETIYLTPSREPAGVQEAIVETARRAVAALGLNHGPVHAEMRVNERGVWMIEVAPRPIGGLCARTLRFEPNEPLESLILRHALGQDVAGARLAGGASGVMMIPIPREGIYEGFRGEDAALAIPEIEDVIVTAKPGQHFRPLPEGSSYLGFLFARGASPAPVEAALRGAHACLSFDFTATLPVRPA